MGLGRQLRASAASGTLLTTVALQVRVASPHSSVPVPLTLLGLGGMRACGAAWLSCQLAVV